MITPDQGPDLSAQVPHALPTRRDLYYGGAWHPPRGGNRCV